MSKKEILSPVVINEKVVLAEDVEPEEIPMKKLEAGDFKGLRELLTGKDRAKYMKLLIKSLNNTLEASRKEAIDLKERGFWGRLKSNNVNDIGAVLGKQSIVIACLYLLIQMQSFSIEACNDILAALYKEVDKISEESTDQSSVIAQTFQEVIEGYKKRLEKDGVRDKALMKLLKAAENSKDFESDIRGELENAKSEYSAAVKKLFDINQNNQNELTNLLRAAKLEFDLKISEIEKSHQDSIELISKHLQYTIFAFSITTAALLIGLIASFIF